MANRRQRNDAKNSQEFKRTINQDVTQEDQRNARSSNKQYRNKKGRKGNQFKSRDGKYTTDTQNIAWYSKNPKLLQAVANLPFVEWYGDPIETDFVPNVSMPLWKTTRNAISGIMALDILPSFGNETKPTDPVNLAAEKLWSYIFHTVSGQAFADAPDMMMYILSMCEVYSYIVWLEFIYGMRNQYHGGNTYLPEDVITMQNVDYDDVVNNQLKLWGGINTLINQASALSVPKEFTLFSRRAFMFQNAYIDGSDIKSQIYMFRPAGFYMFVVQPDSGTPTMTFQRIVDLFPNHATVDELLATGTNLINALLASQDTKKLSSLTLRAFGSEGILHLNELDMGYQTPMLYSLEVLEQIKNATVLSMSGIDESTLTVTQNMSLNCLTYDVKTLNVNLSSLTPVQEFKAWTNAYWLSRDKVLTTSVANPSPDIIVENSRLMASGYTNSLNTSQGGVIHISGASELCVGMRVLYRDSSGTSNNFVDAASVAYDLNNTAYTKEGISQMFSYLRNRISNYSQFKF